MRRRVFTPQVLAAIPELVALGASSEEIAQRIGCPQKSLIVTCCREGISLRRNPQPKRPKQRPRARRNIMLRSDVIEAFEQHTPGNDRTVRLVERLLTVIARDNLINAVLDDEVVS
jgi:hypothetical protein